MLQREQSRFRASTALMPRRVQPGLAMRDAHAHPFFSFSFLFSPPLPTLCVSGCAHTLHSRAGLGTMYVPHSSAALLSDSAMTASLKRKVKKPKRHQSELQDEEELPGLGKRRWVELDMSMPICIVCMLRL